MADQLPRLRSFNDSRLNDDGGLGALEPPAPYRPALSESPSIDQQDEEVRGVVPGMESAPAAPAIQNPRAGGISSQPAGALPLSQRPRAQPPVPGVIPYRSQFEAASAKYGVPVNILIAIAEKESSFNPNARPINKTTGEPISSAKGLMQFLDGTAKRYGVNQYDPVSSIDGAARMFRDHLNMGMTMEEATAAHWGGGGWRGKDAQYQANARAYMDDVLAKAKRYRASYANGSGAAGASVAAGSISPQQDAEKVRQREIDARSLFSRLREAVPEGYNQMTTSLSTARYALGGGDARELAQTMASQFEQQRKSQLSRTTGQKELDAQIQAINDADGFFATAGQIAKLFGVAAMNPSDTTVEVGRNLANSLPTYGGGIVGAGGGAAIGSTVPIFGTAAGLVVGGRAGMALGTTTTELGAEIQQVVTERLQASKKEPTAENIELILRDKTFMDDARARGLAKGLTVAAVDQLTMGLAGKAARAPVEAAAKKKLASEGVDVSTRKAARDALRSDAGREALATASPGVVRRAGGLAGGVAIETAGEGVGEALSQLVARGEVDIGEAAAESVFGLGQSVIDTGIGAGMRGAGAGLYQARGGREGEIAREMNRAASQIPDATAQDVSDRFSAGERPRSDRDIAMAETEAAAAEVATEAVAADELAAAGAPPAGSAPGIPASGPTSRVVEATIAPTSVTDEQPVDQSDIESRLDAALASGQAGTITEDGDIVPSARQVPASVAPSDIAPAAAAPGVPGTEIPSIRTLSTDRVVTPAGRELDVDYALVEAGDLITSNDDGGAVNPAYPQELQPRDRRRASSEMQINDIARNTNPRLLAESATTADGAPMVSADGVVESGNGRTLAIKRAYTQGTDGAARYREFIEERFGDQAAGMAAPVLVRVRRTDLTPEERIAYTKESNERTSMELSSGERAQADASIIPSIIDEYRGGDLSSAINAPFVRKFVQGAVADADKNKVISDADNQLSQDGRRRIEAAIMSAAYRDADIVQDLFESADSDIKAIGGAMLDAAPAWAKMRAMADSLAEGVDLTDNLIEAVKIVRRARAEGRPVAELIDTTDIFSGVPEANTVRFLRAFYRGDRLVRARSRQAVGEFLNGYANAAMQTQAGSGLFGDAPSGTDILENANERLEAGERDGQVDLFAAGRQPAEQPARDSGREGSGPRAETRVEARAGEAEQRPVAEQPAATYGADNKLVTADRAAELRARMKAKLGQLNAGLDPEMIAIGTELAVFHIEAGARKFADFARTIAADLDVGIDRVRPYLRSWYNGARDMMEDSGVDVSDMDAPDQVRAGLAALDDTPAAAEPARSGSLVQALSDAVKAEGMPKDNNALKRMVAKIDGEQPGPERMKQAQEDLEPVLVKMARDIVAAGGTERSIFDKLLALYESQPALNVRSSSSIMNQAYSTPAPAAYLAAIDAGIGRDTTVYEPTAGNGMLLITASPDNATANELDQRRFSNLSDAGFDAMQGDALEAISSGAVAPKSKDAVITNPPFDRIRDDAGKPIKVSVDGFKIGKLDHQIVAESLKAMKDDGRASIIIGADKVAGGISTDDRIFLNWLYSKYNVVGHYEIDGKLYARQGAGWPIRVITVDGRRDSNRVSPKPGTIQRAMTWEQVYEQHEMVGTQQPSAERSSAAADQLAASGATDAAAAPGRTAGATAVSGQLDGERGSVASAGADTRAGRERDVGVAGRSDVPRPDAGATVTDRLEPAQEAAPAGRAQGDSRRADPAVPAGRPPVDTDGDDYQAAYKSKSGSRAEGALIPVNMAQPMQQFLSELEERVGDLGDYVTAELGYQDRAEMEKALMDLQVDSVAAAISNIKNDGKATIIADQTGIGKGRQAAAIIRWANRNGKTPVFITVQAQLFTDMFGDLADINTGDIRPFIMNADGNISLADGKKVFGNRPGRAHAANLESIAADHALPGDSNALFLTYSQINKENAQRRALRAIADNAVFIMDESHNAAGSDSSTNSFMVETLQNAPGVVYLSATYAKRPDNMSLYYRTDIGQAAGDNNALMDAMDRGGLPLQTVVANNLVRAGQMFRRERSYAGINIMSKTITASRAKHEAMSDAATEALRAIVAADKEFHTTWFEAEQQRLSELGQSLQDIGGSSASETVNHTEFSAVVHNFVKQMLLGMKADEAANEAIALLKAGEKPLIALENTMGSFLTQYVTDNNIKAGDILPNYDYRSVLSRALDRTRVVTRVLPNGEKELQDVSLAELDPVTRQRYDDAQAIIDSLNVDIPASPIDWIRNRITQAGYSVREITGRTHAVDYSGDSPRLSSRDAQERTDKVSTTRDFNSGKLDVIILNVSGSTGISLHSAAKFADQRKRHMIIAQAAGDINIFMQMLGRINRTGQVNLPGYTILNADLPAEIRPTAVLSKKMKSLNANTSSNTESATSVKTVDLLNKYGDQVVNRYLIDNLSLAEDLGVEIAADDPADIARKATGRLALMPVSVQRQFYEDVEPQYNELIEYLNSTGQNDLIPKTYDLDAREIRSIVISEKQGTGSSPFTEEAVYNEFSIKAQGKPMTPDEVRAQIDKNLGGKTAQQVADAMRAKLDESLGTFYGRIPPAAVPGAQSVAGAGRRFLIDYPIGRMLMMTINDEDYVGVVLDVDNSHRAAGNPYALSKFSVKVAVNGSMRQISVPGSQMESLVKGQALGSIDQQFAPRADEREMVKVITGNLLAAYGELTGTTRGQIINFTRADGTTTQGILLPKTFSPKVGIRQDVVMPDAAGALAFLRSMNSRQAEIGIASRDGNVRVTPDADGGITIHVPKSQARGGIFYKNADLLAATGDFFSRGSIMRATVPAAKSADAITALMNIRALYALPSMADEAREALGIKGPEIRVADATALAELEQQETAPIAVDAPQPQGDGTFFESQQFQHTKTGETIFVARAKEFLSDQQFSAARTIARDAGGYFSKFSGTGAIPGFHFKSEAARSNFLSGVAGNDLFMVRPSVEKLTDINGNPLYAELGPDGIPVRPVGASASLGVAGTVEALVAAGLGPLLESGKIRVIRNESEFSGMSHGTQALALGRDGPIVINARMADRNRIVGLALHEAFHSGAKSLLGDKQWQSLTGELLRMYRQQLAGTGRASQFWRGVADQARTGGIVDMGYTPEQIEALRAEELGAYAIDNFDDAPATVKKWVEKVIGAVQAWVLRNTGLQLGRLTAGQLHAIAKGALTAATIQTEPARDGATMLRAPGAMPTVEVDGVTRPAQNSDGRAIHPTEEGIAAFWRWFGDSKVVDEQGRPRVMYHGTASDFSVFSEDEIGTGDGHSDWGDGFYFASNPAAANTYATEAGGNVMPVYLAINNPAGRQTMAQVDSRADDYFETVQEVVSGLGHDGVVIDHGADGIEAVIFRPGQAKSATGNVGEFDSDSDSLLLDLADGGRDQYQVPSAKRIVVSSRLKKILAEESPSREALAGLLDDIETSRELRAAQRPADRVRGYDWFNERMSRAVRTGEIGRDAYELARWFVEQNPAVVEDLALSVREPGANNGAAGQYSPPARLLTLFSGNDRVHTLTHEILHHTERMMPADVQEGIRREWRRALSTAIRKSEPGSRQREVFSAIINAEMGITQPLQEIIRSGRMPYDLYHLTNPSEYWAVTGPQIISRRRDAAGSWVRRAAQWLSELGQRVRSLLNLPSDAPVLRALDAIVAGDGSFQSETMLGNGVGGYYRDLEFGSGPAESRFEINEETRLQRFQRGIQDDFNRMKVVQDAVVAQGGKVTEEGDVYRAYERMPGRVEARQTDFENDEVKPLVKALVDGKLTLSDLQEYAYARHAHSRNAYIASINPRFQDGGSGMTNAEADAILDRWNADPRIQSLLDAHQRLMDISKGTRDLIKRSGLESSATVEAWETMFDDYVPLIGFETVDEFGREAPKSSSSTGRGLSVRGRESRAATGRESRSAEIIENLLLQRERAIIRSEKLAVDNALLRFVLDNPDSSRWEINEVQMKPVVAGGRTAIEDIFSGDPSARPVNEGGQVKYVPVVKRYGDDVIALKVKGREVVIRIKGDDVLAEQLQRRESTNLPFGFRELGKLNRFYASLWTQYSPVFAVTNYFKDYTFGVAAAYARTDAKTAARAAKYALPVSAKLNPFGGWAMKAIYDGIRGIDSEGARWYNEFRAAGGKTGLVSFRDTEAQLQRLNELMGQASGEESKVRAAWRATKGVIDGANNIIESAFRLALYRAAREGGRSKAEAASLAKNITVNFNRKGEQSLLWGSLYMFFNAGVQGTVNLMQLLQSKKFQAVTGTVVVGAMALGALNVMLGGSDDDDEPWYDKVPDSVKRRNIVIMLPPGGDDGEPVLDANGNRTAGRYIKIPFPYGMAFFKSIGDAVYDKAWAGKDSAAVAGNLMEAFLMNFNPVGDAVPSPFAPFIQATVTNKDSFGRSIMPEQSQFDEPIPDSERYWPSTEGTIQQRLARWINEATGGNEVRPGSVLGIDTSISPEAIEHVFRQFSGGIGTMMSDVSRFASSDEPDASMLPFAKQVTGRVPDSVATERFYENRSSARLAAAEYELVLGTGNDALVSSFERENQWRIDLVRYAETTSKRLSKIRKDIVAMQGDEGMIDSEKKEAVRELKRERTSVATEFNRAWNEARRENEK